MGKGQQPAAAATGTGNPNLVYSVPFDGPPEGVPHEALGARLAGLRWLGHGPPIQGAKVLVRYASHGRDGGWVAGVGSFA
jgi:hypothetical protein